MAAETSASRSPTVYRRRGPASVTPKRERGASARNCGESRSVSRGAREQGKSHEQWRGWSFGGWQEWEAEGWVEARGGGGKHEQGDRGASCGGEWRDKSYKEWQGWPGGGWGQRGEVPWEHRNEAPVEGWRERHGGGGWAHGGGDRGASCGPGCGGSRRGDDRGEPTDRGENCGIYGGKKIEEAMKRAAEADTEAGTQWWRYREINGRMVFRGPAPGKQEGGRDCEQGPLAARNRTKKEKKERTALRKLLIATEDPDAFADLLLRTDRDMRSQQALHEARLREWQHWRHASAHGTRGVSCGRRRNMLA